MDALAPLVNWLSWTPATPTNDVLAVRLLQFGELAVLVYNDATFFTLEDLRPEAGHEFVAETAEVETLDLTVLPFVL